MTPVTLHATALQIFNTGVLITGSSGSGKSECALELIARGHALVADDLVFVKKTDAETLVAHAKQGMGSFLNIRGAGIVDIAKVYGAQFVVFQVTLNLMIELSNEGTANDYELLGFEEKTIEILGVPIQHVVIPALPQSVLATRIELIVKNNSLSSSHC